MNNIQPCTFGWINPKLEIKKSTVEGEGYIANQEIARNEILIVQGGRCLHVSEIDDTELEKFAYHSFQVEKEIYMYPYINGDVPVLDGIFKINHSCSPNAGFKGQITLVSMRTIYVGEEIHFDYAMTDIEFGNEKKWDEIKCNCGSTQCRGKVTGSDWRKDELQKKYTGYFSQHVANAIAGNSNNS